MLINENRLRFFFFAQEVAYYLYLEDKLSFSLLNLAFLFCKWAHIYFFKYKLHNEWITLVVETMNWHLSCLLLWLYAHNAHTLMGVHTHIYIFVCIYIYVQVHLVAQSCLTLCDPIDCSPPVSSVLGTLQAGILEWNTSPSPGNLTNSRTEPISPASPALQVDSLPLNHQGSPYVKIFISISCIYAEPSATENKILLQLGVPMWLNANQLNVNGSGMLNF